MIDPFDDHDDEFLEDSGAEYFTVEMMKWPTKQGGWFSKADRPVVKPGALVYVVRSNLSLKVNRRATLTFEEATLLAMTCNLMDKEMATDLSNDPKVFAHSPETVEYFTNDQAKELTKNIVNSMRMRGVA